MKKPAVRLVPFLRMMSGGVAVQAILSASNFAVGLLLVRRTPDAQYGYYVLVATAVLLSTTIQGSFFQPIIVLLTRADKNGRASLMGCALRDQRRVFPFIALLGALVGIALGLAGKLNVPIASVLAAGTMAVIASVRREFFRMVLFAYQRPEQVLKSDAMYCVLLIGGAYAATLTPFPAAAAACTLALACLIGSFISAREIRRDEPWDIHAPSGKMRELATGGTWSAFGGTVHWLFGQGYNYLVAGTLDVSAVAAVAATRLLVMPVSLLSTGIGSIVMPMASRWTHAHGASTVLKRLVLFASGLAAVASCYLLMMWLARGWIFVHLLKKNFPNRDLLLMVWAAIALVTVFRDQIIYFLTTRGRYRLTSSVTLLSAILSLSVSVAAMRHVGVVGALYGLLAGEVFNVAGIVFFSIRVAREPA